MSGIGNQPGKPAFGAVHADVRDWQAATALTDNAPAIQAAHDALVQSNTTLSGGTNLSPGVVFVPAGTWQVRQPIWLDGDNITLQGEGPGVSILAAHDYHPVLIVGVKRRTAWNASARDTETLTGTLAFTHGSASVTGTGTVFRDQLLPGCQIKLNADGILYTVASIQSDTALTLTVNFAGSTGSGAATRDMAYLASMPAIFAADHRLDCFNKLDTSVSTAANQHWGITTRSPSSGSPYPDHFVSVSGFPPANGKGDGWTTVKTLVIDFAIEGPTPVGGGTSGPPQGRAIFGMGPELQPDPWQLDQEYNSGLGHREFKFTFYTAQGYQAYNQPRTFTFGNVDSLSGVSRVTVQIDFTHNQDGTTNNSALCAIHCWVNGVEQTVTRGYGTRLTAATGTEPSFTAADGLSYQLNKVGPFQIGNNDVLQNDWRPTGDLGYRGCFNLYGLYIGTGADYVTTGGVQARADAGTLNDAYRYMGTGRNSSNLVAYLYLGDPPTADWQGKIVRFQSGAQAGNFRAQAGLFLHGDDSNGAVSNITIRDIQAQSLSGIAGKTIAVGQCINLTFEDVAASGGWQGLGAFNVGAVYFVRLLGYNQFSGTDCGVYGFNWVVRAEPINVGYVGWSGVRLVGCDAKFNSIVGASYTRNPSTLVDIKNSGYAGTYELGEVYVDQEGSPAQPAVTCERHQVGLTTLTIHRLGAGYQDGTTPQVKLVDFWPTLSQVGTGPARLNLSGVLNNRGLIVQTVGQWEGEITGLASTIGTTTQPVQSVDTTGTSKVISTHYLDDIPNNISGATGSVWLAGAHRIIRRNPPSGGWTQAVCTGSGTVGGSPSPTWQTFNNVP